MRWRAGGAGGAEVAGGAGEAGEAEEAEGVCVGAGFTINIGLSP
ncbi:hypothetical protein [Coleofasciculus sp. F4-SAH-05]